MSGVVNDKEYPDLQYFLYIMNKVGLVNYQVQAQVQHHVSLSYPQVTHQSKANYSCTPSTYL